MGFPIVTGTVAHVTAGSNIEMFLHPALFSVEVQMLAILLQDDDIQNPAPPPSVTIIFATFLYVFFGLISR